jgi:UDPglucose 6-dehydrogenase
MGRKIAVVGAGYVGLTTGACLSHLGHDVTCIESNPDKVELLSQGRIPISEPGLAEIVEEGLSSNRLRFTLDREAGVKDREFIFLCVPTPQDEDGSADLSYLVQAASELKPYLQPGSIVINKSTVPVGSTHVVADALGRSDVHVVSNPEFLREGSAVADFLKPERVVIGADDSDVAARVAGLQLRRSAPLLVTDPESAELIKYASNAFLATKISYANSIAALAEAVGADMDDVVIGMGLDSRIGSSFLQPGPGWGGSCLPKDTSALMYTAQSVGYSFSMLDEVVKVNNAQFDRVVEKTEQVIGGSLEGMTIAVWGLTFKAGTDDLRESPSLEVISRLRAKGAKIRGYDPEVKGSSPILEGIEIAVDPYKCCTDADALVVLTEWPEFSTLDLDRVVQELSSPRVVDTRNVLDRVALRRRGFVYRGIGRV